MSKRLKEIRGLLERDPTRHEIIGLAYELLGMLEATTHVHDKNSVASHRRIQELEQELAIEIAKHKQPNNNLHMFDACDPGAK